MSHRKNVSGGGRVEKSNAWSLLLDRGELGHSEMMRVGVAVEIVLPATRTNIKAQLAFARLTQDGDDEGCFYLDRLFTQAEAGPIRDSLGIRKGAI